MLDIALHFERLAVDFNPLVLIVPGLTAVLAGLFVWLGGLGLRKILSAVIGAAAGGTCGFFVIGRNMISVGALAAFFAFIAVIFERIFITIMAAALAMILGFAVLARPYIEEANRASPINQSETQRRPHPYNIEQTVRITKAYIADFSTEIKRLYSQMPVYNWVIIAALGLIFIAGGVFLWRLTCALCCAAWGTVFIFAGMILLLFYKGVTPIYHICGEQTLYLSVFAAMIAFGTAEQLILCSRTRRKKKPAKKERVDKTDEDSGKKIASWRTA